MASEQLDKTAVITKLSNQARQEYEGLQRRHETAAMECKKLEQERDEAVKKLNEFQQVSQMVIEEVNVIQQSLEIERTCRESAEALASKLNRQNRSLKRKSMMPLAHLSPETITEINLDDDEDDEDEDEEEGEELHAASDVCLSPLSQPTVSEEHRAVQDLEEAREQLRGTREELLKEKQNNDVLMAESERQKKLLAKYNRVSQFAVEEYEMLQDSLTLERDLRSEAEGFARAMMVEQTKLKRQSQILMQSSSPSVALQEALSQVSRLTQDLETQRLDHQNQMKQMEDELRSCEAQRELRALRRKLELVEEEKKEYGDDCAKAKRDVKDLQHTVEELRQKLQAVTNPPRAAAPPPPPPPPPPPLPPPASATPSNPLSSLLSLIRKRRDVGTDVPLGVLDSAQTPDVRQQAVDEMMHRIKKGVQLRPVGQSPNRTRRQMERRPSNSAIQELKGIMETFGRSPSPHPKAAPPPPPSPTRDEQLQRILLRRRDALEPQRHDAGLPPAV